MLCFADRESKKQETFTKDKKAQQMGCNDFLGGENETSLSTIHIGVTRPGQTQNTVPHQLTQQQYRYF